MHSTSNGEMPGYFGVMVFAAVAFSALACQAREAGPGDTVCMAEVTRMAPGGFKAFGGFAAVGLVGASAAIYVLASRSGEEVVPQVELPLPTISVPTPVCTFVKDAPCNPDAGLSDAERDALYKRLRAEGDQQYMECLATTDIAALDLRSLPRREMPALYLAGESSLSEAVAEADLIIAGTVLEIRLTPSGVIDTVLDTHEVVKGVAGSTIVITQAGRLQPTEDRSGIEIVEAANGPMLVPGDRAVLLLQKTEPVGEATGNYYIQSYTGWYQIVDGRVVPNGGNSWGASLGEKTEPEFLDLLKATVR